MNLSSFKNLLEEQFEHLESLILKTDASFKGAVKAQKSKQLKGIERLELRLLKAQKIKLKDHVQRLVHLHEKIFPGEQLQERVENFSDFYLQHGIEFIDFLLETFEPLSAEFYLIED